MVAQCHQGDDFAFVQVYGERTLDRNGAIDRLVEFITGDNAGGSLETGVG
jgi:hypothetical protein